MNTHITNIMKQFGFGDITWSRRKDGTIQIQAENKSFVLHQSSMNNERLKNWKAVFPIANKKQIRSVIPIYPTCEGNLYVEDNQKYTI